MKIIQRYPLFNNPDTNFRRYDRLEFNQEIITNDVEDNSELRKSFEEFCDNFISVFKLFKFKDFIPSRPKYFVLLIQDKELNYNYFYEFYIEIERVKLYFKQNKNDFYNYSFQFLKDSTSPDDYRSLEIPLHFKSDTLIYLTCIYPIKSLILIDENGFLIEKNEDRYFNYLIKTEIEIIENAYRLMDQYLASGADLTKEEIISHLISKTN